MRTRTTNAPAATLGRRILHALTLVLAGCARGAPPSPTARSVTPAPSCVLEGTLPHAWVHPSGLEGIGVEVDDAGAIVRPAAEDVAIEVTTPIALVGATSGVGAHRSEPYARPRLVEVARGAKLDVFSSPRPGWLRVGTRSAANAGDLRSRVLFDAPCEGTALGDPRGAETHDAGIGRVHVRLSQSIVLRGATRTDAEPIAWLGSDRGQSYYDLELAPRDADSAQVGFVTVVAAGVRVSGFTDLQALTLVPSSPAIDWSAVSAVFSAGPEEPLVEPRRVAIAIGSSLYLVPTSSLPWATTTEALTAYVVERVADRARVFVEPRGSSDAPSFERAREHRRIAVYSDANALVAQDAVGRIGVWVDSSRLSSIGHVGP